MRLLPKGSNECAALRGSVAQAQVSDGIARALLEETMNNTPLIWLVCALVACGNPETDETSTDRMDDSGSPEDTAVGDTGDEPTGIPDAVQWSSADRGNDHYYRLVVVPEGVTWFEAQTAAEVEGGTLATITSAAENDFVYALAQAEPDARVVNTSGFTVGPWLGGLQEGDDEPAGGWRWVTDEAIAYEAWMTEQAQPNDASGIEDHMAYLFLSTDEPTWGDYPAEPSGKEWQALVQSYVIEWDSAD